MMAAQFGSQIVTSGPNMVRLRLELFSYERETIEAAITGYLEKLLRMHPTFVPADYHLLQIHDVLNFSLPGETSTQGLTQVFLHANH